MKNIRLSLVIWCFPLMIWAQNNPSSDEIMALWRHVGTQIALPVGTGTPLMVRAEKPDVWSKIGTGLVLYGLLVAPSSGQIRMHDTRAGLRFTLLRSGVAAGMVVLADYYDAKGACGTPENSFDDPCDAIGWGASMLVTGLIFADLISATGKIGRVRGRTSGKNVTFGPKAFRIRDRVASGAMLSVSF